MKNKDITNFNSKGQWYGYQEWYCDNELWFRGNMKFNLKTGYIEYHWTKQTEYNIR